MNANLSRQAKFCCVMRFNTGGTQAWEAKGNANYSPFKCHCFSISWIWEVSNIISRLSQSLSSFTTVIKNRSKSSYLKAGASSTQTGHARMQFKWTVIKSRKPGRGIRFWSSTTKRGFADRAAFAGIVLQVFDFLQVGQVWRRHQLAVAFMPIWLWWGEYGGRNAALVVVAVAIVEIKIICHLTIRK